MGRKSLFLVLLIVSTAALNAGCSSSTGGSSTAKPSQEILRKSIIGTDWQMYQMRLILPSGSNFPILLKLAEGDRVDGYFFLEKGTNVDFGVNADSPVYHSASGMVVSDRFSFTASKDQGSTYVLQFNTAPNTTEQEVVFLEVVYPIRGSVFIPLETK